MAGAVALRFGGCGPLCGPLFLQLRLFALVSGGCDPAVAHLRLSVRVSGGCDPSFVRLRLFGG